MRRAPTRDRIRVPIMVSDLPHEIICNLSIDPLIAYSLSLPEFCSICNWSEFHGFPVAQPSQWQLYRFVKR